MAHYDGHVEAAREQYIAKLEAKVREYHEKYVHQDLLFAEQDKVRELEEQLRVATAINHAFKQSEENLEAKLQQVEGECAEISAEFGLPPKIRPTTGEIRRMLGQLEAERDQARAALRAIADNLRQKYPPNTEMFRKYIFDEDWWTSGRANNDFECWFAERALKEG